MWKLTKTADHNWVIFRASGHLEAKHLAEIQTALAGEGASGHVVLDLSEVTVMAREAVRFLAREVSRLDVRKYPAHIREWIAQERRAMGNLGKTESDD